MKELTIILEIKMGVSNDTDIGKAQDIAEDYVEQLKEQFDATSEIDFLEVAIDKTDE